MFLPFRSRTVVPLPSTALDSGTQVTELGDTGRWCGFIYDLIPPHELSQAVDILPEAKFSTESPLLTSAVARSADGQRVLKIEFFPHFRKRNALRRETEILHKLNNAECMSAPRLIDSGSLLHEDIVDSFPSNIQMYLRRQERDSYDFMIMDFVPCGGKAPLADIILAMLEQKALGIYHADIKPENIRFDETRGISVFIDYDQAEELPKAIAEMNAADYLDWCDDHERERYHGRFDTWRRHFKGLSHKRDIEPMLRDGAFNLALTTPYRRQATTNTKNGVYHTITSSVIYANGVRDLKDRTELLDTVDFTHGEAVLDIGCNAGLLCHYLASRGCQPTGVEMDSSIVVVAKMIANIMGVNANFIAFDLDNDEIPGKFDTICLFSVIHHTQKLVENGHKIAECCNRILIECRLAENGRKPIKGRFGRVKWVATSAWDYPDEAALSKGLSDLFPGFKVKRKIGLADKGRMLLEMVKE